MAAQQTVQAALVASFIAVPLFSQTPSTPVLDPGLGNLISNVGVLGVLVWYLWYHTRHSQPKMIDKFTAEQTEQRKLFATEQAEQRKLFTEEQAKTRQLVLDMLDKIDNKHNLILDKVLTAFREEQTASRLYHQQEAAELRKALIENSSQMRVAVHDLKNTAEQAIRRVEVTEAKIDAKLKKEASTHLPTTDQGANQK